MSWPATWHRIAIVGCALLCALSHARNASATGAHIGLDLDTTYPIRELGVDTGGGIVIRGGRELDLIAVTVIGELGLGYHSFAGSADANEYTGLAGGRLRIGKVLEPGVLAHIGASHLARDDGSSWAGMFDLGLSLDFTLIPLLDIGVHGTYAHRFATDETSAFGYLILGPHVALVF